MKRKGMTIVEILVGMTIFVLVVTLAVGAFVTVSRMKALTTTMRETQSKLRVANEMISRYAREADQIDTPTNKEVIFTFKGNNPFKASFKIEGTPATLKYYECSGASCNLTDGIDLLSGLVDLDNSISFFSKKGTIPPTFQFTLAGKISNTTSVYYSDSFNITNSTIMEGLQ